MNGHGIDVCACGAVVAQCRCMDHTERRVVAQKCPACSPAKKHLTEEEARAVLREYPDADLRAFEVDGDVEKMAAEEAAKSIDKLRKKIGGDS